MRRFATSIVAVVVALSVGGSVAVSGDGEDDNNPGALSAHISVTERGPVHAGTVGSCPVEPCRTALYVFVRNANRIAANTVGPARDTVPDAFVVSNVVMSLSVNGAPSAMLFTATPPPAAFPRPWSGRWPMTVVCSAPGPCNDVRSPAILPGERTVIFYTVWGHDVSEPDGVHDFTFTVHGTLNGVPTSVSAHTQVTMVR